VPDEARFCPSCGQAVSRSSAEERRVVTVLFGDLVGFTTLAEHRDPEQVKRLVDACFERLVADVVAFGGRIDKLLGDGLVAIFGAPVAHEDDAERAVRAGLRMQETLADFVGDLGEESVAVQMRIGINTGEVLMGHVAGTDYTAMGDVVNAASRLQVAAPPGGVLVGDVTYTRTHEVVRYEPAGEMLLKGRERPIETWLAIGTLAPPGGRRRRQRVLPLVGRASEMALARAALDVALRGGRSVVIAVEGEGGVGKSRLVDELLASVRQPVTTLRGTCVPYGESNVWWPIASALMANLGLEEGIGEAEARELATERVGVLFGSEATTAEANEVIESFMHFLGHDSELDRLDPAGTTELLLGAIAAVMSRMAAEAPVLLAITDVHWADPRVLELLSRALARLANHPLVVVTTSRPDAELHWPPRTNRYTVVSLPLEPLGREAAAQLAAAVVGDVLSPKVADDLYDRSGGNPLFLEELAALIAEGGDVRELPDTLRGLIAARLDQLSSPQRAVIDNAAVLGTAGWVHSLARFAAELRQPFDDEVLAGLVDAGMLDVDGRRWRFRSDSVRDVAYHTLTKAARAARHAGVARTMQQMGDKSLDDLAHHAATAAELVAELGPVPGVPASIGDDALRLLVASADRAMVQGSLHTVIRQATRAIELVGDPSSRAARPALLLRAEGRLEQRDHSGARSDVEMLLAAATKDGDRAHEAEARRLLGSLHHARGHFDQARSELGAAVEILREIGEGPLLARALRTRGFVELFGGSLRDAEWFFGEAEAIYAGLGDRRGLAWIDQHRAWAAFLSGDVVAAEQRLQHAAKALQELGDRSGVGWALGLLAFVAYYDHRFAEAEALAQVVIDEATERGDEWAVGMMQVLQADLLLWQGQPEEALVLADHARSRFRRLTDRYGQMQALAPLVRALVATGRQTAMARAVEELLVLGEGYGNDTYAMVAAAGAAMHAGDASRALTLAERAIVEGGNELGSHELPVIRAMALTMLDRIDEAEVALEDVTAPAAVDHPFTASTRALIAVLGGRPDEAVRCAALVAGREAASYLDRAIARVAGGAAFAALGEIDSARAALVEAVEIAVAAGDVVACALTGRAHHRVLGIPHPHGDGDPAVLGPGWLSVIDRLPHAVAIDR
jgi:class 3 adenylate cyclase/tetratricopeptide (TPR) repeat protein